MEELIKYYCSLLILQYRNKPKAKATIEMLVRTVFEEDITGDIFLKKLENAYDLDTSFLQQLNVLAKYIGYNDKINAIDDKYFKFSDYEGETIEPGFSDYEDKDIEGYKLLDYSGYTYIEKTLVDIAGIEFYRTTLKFLSELKNQYLSLGNLDRLLYKYFGEKLKISTGTKKIIYIYNNELLDMFDNNFDNLVLYIKKYMPRPMGCSLEIEGGN